MGNVIDFEKQLSDIAEYYNRIVDLRESQKDDGIMIRIFLNEIIPMYTRLKSSISENTVLPENVKAKLLEIVQWEMDRAPGRNAKIEEYENTHKAVFTQGYDEDLAENRKLETPFYVMAESYNQIKSLRERQKDDGIMGRIYLDEIIPMYQALREKVSTATALTDGIKTELLSLIDEEIRQAPNREEEIIKAEREYAAAYTKAYNAALARYEALGPVLKLMYAEQLKRLKDDWAFKSIEEINSFFVKTKKPEFPTAPGEDGEH